MCVRFQKVANTWKDLQALKVIYDDVDLPRKQKQSIKQEV